MRLFTYILVVYIVFVSVFPCNDVKLDITNFVTTSQQINSDAEHSKDSDLCSSICICNCCQSTITSYQFITEIDSPQEVESIYSKEIIIAHNNLQGQLYVDIWQPPKI